MNDQVRYSREFCARGSSDRMRASNLSENRTDATQRNMVSSLGACSRAFERAYLREHFLLDVDVGMVRLCEVNIAKRGGN